MFVSAHGSHHLLLPPPPPRLCQATGCALRPASPPCASLPWAPPPRRRRGPPRPRRRSGRGIGSRPRWRRAAPGASRGEWRCPFGDLDSESPKQSYSQTNALDGSVRNPRKLGVGNRTWFVLTSLADFSLGQFWSWLAQQGKRSCLF